MLKMSLTLPMKPVQISSFKFALVLFLPGCALMAGTALAQSRIWVGDPAGTWNNSGGGWNGNIPPQTTDNVYIDQNPGQQSTVSLTVDSSIRGLFIDSGDTLRITGAKQLDITGAPPQLTADQLQIAGNLDMTEGGNNRLYLTVLHTFKTGGGALTMRNQAQIYGPGALWQRDGSITGSGLIGAANMGLRNEGMIGASYAGETLQVNGVARPDMADRLYNSGTFLATGGGTLLVSMASGSIFDNQGGVVHAHDASTVRFFGGTVEGGVFNTSGTGEIRFQGLGFNSLSNLTNKGTVRGDPGSALVIGNGVVNEGRIIAGDTFTAGLYVDSALTMNGGGAIGLGDTYDGVIRGDGTLTLGNQTIQGRGNLCANTLNVVVSAQASVKANVNGAMLRIDPPAAGFTNQGFLQAENGAELLFFLGVGEVIQNAGGVIQAMPASTVRLTGNTNSTYITGGTLRSIGDGIVDIVSSGIEDLRIEGTVKATGNWTANKVITNTGLIRNNATMTLLGDTTLVGGGSLRLGEPGVAFGLVGGTDVQLTIDDQRLEGLGFIGQNTGMEIAVSPASSIVANVPAGELNLGNNAITLTSGGVLRAENGGILRFYRGTFTVAPGGRVEALDGSTVNESTLPTLTNNSGGVLSGGTYLVRGRTAAASMTLPGGNITENAATITLDGTLSNWGQLTNLNTNSGQFELATHRDFSTAGAFSNTGTLILGAGSVFTSGQAFSQSGTGKTKVLITGEPSNPDHSGKLQINAASTLGGTLHVHFDRSGGFIPEAGQTWRVVAGSALTGIFGAVSITGLPLNLQGNVTYVPGAGVDITLGIQTTYNYNQWAAAYPFDQPADALPDADPDGDGVDNLTEFGFLMNPLAGDVGLLPVPQHIGGSLTVSFNQSAGISGVTYGAQTSENLATWSPVPDTGTGGVHTFSQADESKSKRYMRLTVTVSN
jgi:hypothetical protein